MTKRAQTAVSLLPLPLLPALAYWLARWGWDWLWGKRPLALIMALSGVNVALLILFFRIWRRGAQRWRYMHGDLVMARYLAALPRLSRPDTPQILCPLGIYLLWWNLVGLFWLSGATVSTRWRS
ncbi:MAG: hypothetical protein IAE79_13690 [Anaerolinea sp.]|nr:hypothetical protein [Anaerolinea sp.]